MEPNTQIITPNKNKKIFIIIGIIILVIIIVVVLMKSKSAPVDTTKDNAALREEKELTAELDNAVSFDNEADLKLIDKEF